MNVLVMVHSKDDVVDVWDESLKPCVIAFVGWPCFGVNRGVFVAKFVISSSCIERLPIDCVEHCRCLKCLFYFPDEGRGGRNDLIGAAFKKAMSSPRAAGFSFAIIRIKNQNAPPGFSNLDSKKSTWDETKQFGRKIESHLQTPLGLFGGCRRSFPK